jgi:hypothetical protein
MSARKRINKQKFYAINRDVKIPGSQVKSIAAVHNVSEETVRTIKRAKTWPRFEDMKKLKNEKRQTFTGVSAKDAIPAMVELGQSGLSLNDHRPSTRGTPQEAVVPVQQPLTPEEHLDRITQAPDNQIRPVPSEEIKVVTVAEWEGILRKFGQLYSRQDQLRATQLQRKPLLSIFRRTK